MTLGEERGVALLALSDVEQDRRRHGQTPPLPSALAQAALETDPAAKAQVLAGNAMTPLERALASFQRSILARDS